MEVLSSELLDSCKRRRYYDQLMVDLISFDNFFFFFLRRVEFKHILSIRSPFIQLRYCCFQYFLSLFSSHSLRAEPCDFLPRIHL